MEFENPQWTAGAGENGADVVMSVNLPFFEEPKIVVQAKHHNRWSADNDTSSIQQLRKAFQYYNAMAGLLVTSAEQLGPDLAAELEKLRSEGRQVAALYGNELYRRVLQVLPSKQVEALQANM
jgi:Restriction endonuclease